MDSVVLAVAEVIRVFEYEYNRRQASAQDYECAKAAYREARSAVIESRSEHAVSRFGSMLERKNAAYDKSVFYRYNFEGTECHDSD